MLPIIDTAKVLLAKADDVLDKHSGSKEVNTAKQRIQEAQNSLDKHLHEKGDQITYENIDW
jgi:ppGpp synthetase/RelA/SpoT-type nucleotidyltranferase